MYNSSINTNLDETDMTMIDQSLLYGDNDEPVGRSIVKRLQQANQSATSKPTKYPTTSDDTSDYIYIDHNPLQAAKQIEQILNFYRQELKQESNTQFDCDRQLTTRLIDFIRPAYSSDRQKMKDLDILYDEILVCHDIRFIEQREKNEQLNNEIIHLKKLIITSTNEDDRNDNTMTKVYQINSMVNYKQWMEMEEEAKKLLQLVERQRDQINELVQLLLQEDKVPVGQQRPTASDEYTENTSATTVRASNDRQQPASGMSILQKSTDELHSSGTSPIHSLTDFLTKTLVDTVNNEIQNEEIPRIIDPLPRSPLSRMPSYNDMKNCPICNHEFPSSTDYVEMFIHVERCLASVDNDNSTSTNPNQHECPTCKQQIPGNDEDYIKHLTDCLT